MIGFPTGYTTTAIKALEVGHALEDGADEVDMVLPIGSVKQHEYAEIFEDIHSVVEAAKGRVVKVILETCYLTDEEKVMGATIAVAAGAHYVKTSTGFGPSGAAVEDIRLMRKVVGEHVGIKAAGGIRTQEFVKDLISAGADRIGASSTVAILTE